MKNIEENAGLCALNRIFGFTPKTAHAIISVLGDAAGIFRLPQKEIDDILGPYSRHKGEICLRAYEEAFKELESLYQKGIRFIGCTDSCFPELLKDCEDSPIGLYVRSCSSAEEIFSGRRNIAVVGTRDVSPYGKEWCRNIVKAISSASAKQTSIISGLALGTDFHAHNAALEAGTPTIAVMATGPESIYPSRHRAFAEHIAATPGCALITDYPPGTSPLALHFLRRNRIIAGMSEATILIESKLRGGGMTTSRLAFSYNREVYALPGRADDLRSQGCNRLIREKTAEPITDIADLLSALNMKPQSRTRKLTSKELIEITYGKEISPDSIGLMCNILEVIRQHRGITINEICNTMNIGYSTASSIINMLETDGIISVDILQRCCANVRKSELFM